MQIIKGVVQQISVKEPRDGEHGKFAGFGIKINDAWHNGLCNEDRDSGAFIVKDKDYQEVKVGQEVEFLVVEKNNYKNIDKKTFKILSSGSGAQQPKVEQQPKQQEEVANTPADTSTKDKLVMDMCKEFAYAIAFAKFEGKELPSSDQIERMAQYYFKTYKK